MKVAAAFLVGALVGVGGAVLLGMPDYEQDPAPLTSGTDAGEPPPTSVAPLRGRPSRASEPIPKSEGGPATVDPQALREMTSWMEVKDVDPKTLGPAHLDVIVGHLTAAREARDPQYFRAYLRLLAGIPSEAAATRILHLLDDESLVLPERSLGIITTGVSEWPRELVRPFARARATSLLEANKESDELGSWLAILARHADRSDVLFLEPLTEDPITARPTWIALAQSPRADARDLVLKGLSEGGLDAGYKTLLTVTQHHPDAALTWGRDSLEQLERGERSGMQAHMTLSHLAIAVPKSHVPQLLRLLEAHAAGPYSDAVGYAAMRLVALRRVTREKVAALLDIRLDRLRKAITSYGHARAGQDVERAHKELSALHRLVDGAAYETAEVADLLDEAAETLGSDPLARNYKSRASSIRRALAQPWRGR